MHLDSLSPRMSLILIMIAGVIGGVVLMLPVLILAPLLGIDTNSALLLAGLGYPIGAAIGAWAAGRRLISRGRLWHSLVGAFVPVMILLLIFAPMGFQPVPLVQGLSIALPPIFAALALQRFSRPIDPANPYDDDQVDLLAYHEEGWEDEV